MYAQKISRFWWLSNSRYTIYFLRELTGVIIAVSVILFIISFFLSAPQVFRWFVPVAFVAALFHTLTWFWVTIKISPLPALRLIRLMAFFSIAALWLFVSYFLLKFLYVPS